MLVTAFLCKNEADKDLRRVLTDARRYSDRILVLDDGSTDGSQAIARELGCDVRERAATGMWGNESPARQELWAWGAEVAGDGWLLIQDCDQLLQGDPRPYCQSQVVNTWSFVLYDLWDAETRYRCDGYWQAHMVPRPWLVRPSAVPEGWVPEWPERGLHVGHLPRNWPAVGGIATNLSWLHYSYLTEARRLAKLGQYLAKSDILTPFELAHARSIGD